MSFFDKISINKLLIISLFFIYIPFWFYTIYIHNLQVSTENVTLPILGSDSLEYKILAENIVNLKTFSIDGSNFEIFRTPGYPFFIAAIISIYNSYFLVTLVQIFLVLLTTFFIYKISLMFLSHRRSLLISFIFLLEPSVVLHSSIILSDIPYIFLIIFSIYIILKKESILRYFWVGLIIGLSVLFRPISLFIAPIFVLLGLYVDKNFIIKSVLLKIFLISLGFMIVVFPWIFRNYKVADFIGVSSVSSYNMFYYNIPMFKSWKDGNSSMQDKLDEQLIYFGLERDELRDPNLLPIFDSYSKEFIKNNIFEYSYFHLIKLNSFFFGSSIKIVVQSYNMVFESDENINFNTSISNLFYKGDVLSMLKVFYSESLFTLERIIWLIIFILMFIPVFIKKYRFISIIFILFIFYFAILTGPVSYVRYRLPAVPFMFILAGFSIDLIFNNSFYSFFKRNIRGPIK